MSNEELILRFETDTLPEHSFHHADHVRLAFAYLSLYPVLHALDRFSCALKRFAAARGKSELYNETITHAYFFYGTPDSGLLGVGRFLNTSVRGPNWITGGAAGPEGSIFALVILLLCAMLIHFRFPKAIYPDRPI